MRCPRCVGALHAQPAGRKGTLHACPERHGVFLARDDLRHVLPVAPHAALVDAMARSQPGEAACPACAAPMRTLHPRGVELDGCVACGGVWFDGGELERVKQQPAPGSPHAAAPLQGGPTRMGLSDGATAAFEAPQVFAGIFQIIAAFLDWN